VLYEPQPRRLEHVRRIGIAQTMRPRDAPDQPSVARDERVPRLAISIGRCPDDRSELHCVPLGDLFEWRP
jgi:hypothetical protein